MNDKRKAVVLMIFASLFFAVMSFLVKLASDVPSIEKAMYRNVVGLIIMFIILSTRVFKEGKQIGFSESIKIFKPKNLKFVLLRAVLGTLGVVATYYAIDSLILADSTILTRTSPFFTLLASWWFLGEKINKKTVMAMIISFIGVIFVVKPVFDVRMIPYLIGLTGAIFAGLAYVVLRILGTKGENGNVVVFYFSLFSAVTLAPLAMFVYKDLTTYEAIVILLSSVSAMGAQICITKAYSYAPASEISIYIYFQVIFTAILGFVFLGEIPDIYSVIGYFIVMGASYWLYLENNKSKKEN